MFFLKKIEGINEIIKVSLLGRIKFIEEKVSTRCPKCGESFGGLTRLSLCGIFHILTKKMFKTGNCV